MLARGIQNQPFTFCRSERGSERDTQVLEREPEYYYLLGHDVSQMFGWMGWHQNLDPMRIWFAERSNLNMINTILLPENTQLVLLDGFKRNPAYIPIFGESPFDPVRNAGWRVTYA